MRSTTFADISNSTARRAGQAGSGQSRRRPSWNDQVQFSSCAAAPAATANVDTKQALVSDPGEQRLSRASTERLAPSKPNSIDNASTDTGDEDLAKLDVGAASHEQDKVREKTAGDISDRDYDVESSYATTSSSAAASVQPATVQLATSMEPVAPGLQADDLQSEDTEDSPFFSHDSSRNLNDSIEASLSWLSEGEADSVTDAVNYSQSVRGKPEPQKRSEPSIASNCDANIDHNLGAGPRQYPEASSGEHSETTSTNKWDEFVDTTPSGSPAPAPSAKGAIQFDEGNGQGGSSRPTVDIKEKMVMDESWWEDSSILSEGTAAASEDQVESTSKTNDSRPNTPSARLHTTKDTVDGHTGAPKSEARMADQKSQPPRAALKPVTAATRQQLKRVSSWYERVHKKKWSGPRLME